MRAANIDTLGSELDQARQEIERLELALVDAQRYATVGKLTCFMAHEFKNIMTMVFARASQALIEDDRAKRKEIIQRVIQCSNRATKIARSLMAYGDTREAHSQVLRADQLLDTALELIDWELAKAGVEVIREYDSDAKVRVVRIRVEQVLVNLILNARNAMKPAGGRLTLITAPAEVPGYVALRVRDTGCGILPEHLERIFDPFFTTRRAGDDENQTDGGTGLGLPVAQDLVRQAGGEIHVESTPKVGSTFSVLLPIVEEID